MEQELKELRQKLKDGSITDDEKIRLEVLEKWDHTRKLDEYDALKGKKDLTDKDKARLKEL